MPLKKSNRIAHKKPILKKNPKAPSNWDLYEDGISYSLLSKFVVCRERFRLRTVEALVPEGTKPALHFGTIFHKALELFAHGETQSRIAAHLIRKGRSKKHKDYDPLLCKIAIAMLPFYMEYWSEVLPTLDYFEGETVFRFNYRCSLGYEIPINGKRDEGYIKNGKIWLQENKTMGQINETQLVETLEHMLQPMMYLLSFQEDHPNAEIGGILYNVIRRPGLKQGKKETDRDYLDRITNDIASRPEHYFKMFEIAQTAKDIEEWRLRYFDPLMCQLCLWWESVRHNPFDPWVGKDGLPNPHHFIRPFGVYDPMSHGTGDYFGRIVQGHDAGLIRDAELFPELQEDD